VKSRVSGSANDEVRSLETLSQPGLTIIATFPQKKRKFYLGVVEVSSTRWVSLDGIAPGSNRNVVRHSLGAPTSDPSAGCDVYQHGEDLVRICYRQDVVKTIRWEYFVD